MDSSTRRGERGRVIGKSAPKRAKGEGERVIVPGQGYGGNVTRQATVWCGACENWDMQDTPAVSTWKRMGWRKTKEGWRCPGCIGRTRRWQERAGAKEGG